VELLSKHRSSLARDEQDRLDQSLGRTYLASGQIEKAIEIYERQATATAKDANRQREIAMLLSEFEPREAAVLAKQCWRRVESLSKQGSPEWLTARLGVISTCIKLQEQAEARKLMALAKVLYPELGGGDLKAKFEAEERRLGMSPAK
jgi:tetratricopeptide (TPR) repeat protein